MGSLCCCLEEHQTRAREPLASAYPRASYEMAQEKQGAPIGEKWYHGGIVDEQAKHHLKGSAKVNGDFLVYDAPNQHGKYILLVFYNGDCHQWRISRKRDFSYFLDKDGFEVEPESYQSVRELIKRHRGLTGKPLMFEGGVKVKLNNY